MKYLYFVVIALFAATSAFSQKDGEIIITSPSSSEIVIDTPQYGKIENGYYICDKFGWKIMIPDGYRITEIARVNELTAKGLQAMKGEAPGGLEVSTAPIHLIGFEAEKYNDLKACFETLDGKKTFTLAEHKDFTKKLLENTYAKIKELKYEMSDSELKIGKHKFYKIQIRLYHAKTDRLVLTQEIYNTYIKNNLFSVAINYTKENNGILLNYQFMKSFN